MSVVYTLQKDIYGILILMICTILLLSGYYSIFYNIQCYGTSVLNHDLGIHPRLVTLCNIDKDNRLLFGVKTHMMKHITVYLAGEIHSDWRQRIIQGIEEYDLQVDVLTPVTTHDASDDVGVDILGQEDQSVWKDHKAAKINSIRIRNNIEKSDIVVVKFGDKYRQWNAAFDAGYAIAKGKSLITLHAPELTHPLKEVDASAMAVAQTPEQVVQILKYITTQV